MLLKLVMLYVSINSIVGENLEEGDVCEPTVDISDGKCEMFTDCAIAVSYIKMWRQHPFKRCGFEQSMEIVCCPKNSSPYTWTSTSSILLYYSGTENSPRIADIECKKIKDNSIPPQIDHIFGGEDAQLGEFPHMAALGYLNEEGVYDFSCGGSLISEYYILTAAHCVDNIDHITPSIARLGVVDIGKNVYNPETDKTIIHIIKHPKYVTPHKHHDVALLRLAQPVEYSHNVVPVCLYTGDTIPKVPLTVTGWGIINNRKELRSKILQQANVSEVANSECQRSGISQGQFCAGHPQGLTDTCKGDSGGPLQGLTSSDGYYRLIGITSFGRSCGSSTPGVYTRVFSYLDWIESVVWPKGA